MDAVFCSCLVFWERVKDENWEGYTEGLDLKYTLNDDFFIYATINSLLYYFFIIIIILNDYNYNYAKKNVECKTS